MIINKANLISAIKILDLIPSRPGTPSSEFIEFKNSDSGEKVLSLAMSSEAHGNVFVLVEQEWDDTFKKPFYIDRKVIVPFLMLNDKAKATGVVIERVTKKGTSSISMKIGRRKIQLNAVPKVGGFTSVNYSKDEREGVIVSDAQREIVSCALKFAATDQGLPMLQCVYLSSTGLILSSNDRTIFLGKTDKIKGKGVMLPLFLLSLLAHEKLKRIWTVNKNVVFEFKSPGVRGLIMQSLPEQTLKSFPHESMVKLGKMHKKVGEVFSIEVKNLFKCLNNFNTFLSAAKEKLVVLTGKADDGKIVVSGSTSHAKISDFINVDLKKDFQCQWPLEMVLPFIEFLSELSALHFLRDDSPSIKLSVRFDSKSPYYLISSVATLVVSRKSN